MSITTYDPAVRGATSENHSKPAGSADGLGARLARLAAGRHRAGAAGPESCVEVVDVRTGEPRGPEGHEPTRGRLAQALGLFGARLHFDRRTRGMFAVIMVVVAVVAAAVAWFSWPRPEPAPTALAVAQAEESGAGGGTSVMVSVVGDVVEPGLVEVPAGARVADAIEAAGGLTPETESAGYLNLARKVSDGELIVVGGDAEDPDGEPGDEPTDDPGDEPTDGEPLNINQATEEQLATLPGIGPVTAASIVEFREENGGFDSVEQLTEVSGIGPATLEKISDLVTV
ncbi:MAG: helix-hairpin-helix domain-containing protein [Stackebrandtia sp.]